MRAVCIIASDNVVIDGDVVLLSNDNNLATVCEISDIAYTAREANKNLIVLKQPLGATIHIESNYIQNDIAKKFAEYLSSRR